MQHPNEGGNLTTWGGVTSLEAHSPAVNVAYCMLGVACLGVGCWVLGVGCWVLGVGCWLEPFVCRSVSHERATTMLSAACGSGGGRVNATSAWPPEIPPHFLCLCRHRPHRPRAGGEGGSLAGPCVAHLSSLSCFYRRIAPRRGPPVGGARGGTARVAVEPASPPAQGRWGRQSVPPARAAELRENFWRTSTRFSSTSPYEVRWQVRHGRRDTALAEAHCPRNAPQPKRCRRALTWSALSKRSASKGSLALCRRTPQAAADGHDSPRSRRVCQARRTRGTGEPQQHWRRPSPQRRYSASCLRMDCSSRRRCALGLGYAIFIFLNVSTMIWDVIRRAFSLSSAGTTYQGA